MFGLGALLLSVLMGGLSYYTTRHFLLGERQSASLHQALSNAAVVRTDLQLGSTQVDQQLGSLDTGTNSASVMYVRGNWFSSKISIGERAIPPSLRSIVLKGNAATQTIEFDGSPQIVVGVPLQGLHAAYFEVFDIGDLAHTLRVLALALAAAGLVTTVLGAAIGRAASGRTLRPLTSVSQAAVAIAGGRLDTRLPAESDDPDLAGLTKSFNRMVDQLQERIQRDARFTSDVSHELRSPLTTLSASLEVLEAHHHELSPRAQRALTLLSDDLRRFERMVADLLEMSRSDTGSADVYPEEVEIGELVQRSVGAATRHMAHNVRSPAVKIEPAVDGLRMSVDKRRFERIVANLIENAALYGGGATRVIAGPGPEADGLPTVRVAVEDHGPGVRPAERTKIFERFYRGQAAGRRGAGTGTGLGLALVAEHVHLLGGIVWVEDAPEGGARFVVQLPVEHNEVPW
jgi:signal transduction histidine kinase